MGAVPRSALQLTAEEMREAGYRTVDMLVRHLTDDEAPPIRRATVGAMRELLGQSAPEDPTAFAEVLAGLERDVLQPVDRNLSHPPAVFDPHVALERGWLAWPRVSADELRLLPLFSDLDDVQVGSVLAAAAERTFVEGDALAVEGDGSRELYIVLDGEVAITRGGRPITRLGAGSPIGEIAALEWGAGFGYARTATATAASTVRALVIPAGDVGRLVQEMPVLEERLRVIAHSRLHRE